MKKILSVAFMFLLSVTSYAHVFLASWNVEGYSPSNSPKGVNIVLTPGVAKQLRIQFNMTRNSGTEFNSFKYEIEHTSLNGTRTRIPGASYLNHDWQNSYNFTSLFYFTIPADKTEGEISLVLISYSGTQFLESTTIGSYTLNYKAVPVTPPVTPPIANTEYNKRFVVPDYYDRGIFQNNYGTVVIARNGNFHMDFQADGNLVLYNGTAPLWASGKRVGTWTNLTTNNYGNITTGGLGNEWSSGYYYQTPRKVVWCLQDDGNFVGFSGYSIDSNGNVVPNGDSFGATMTQGGKKSNRSGRLW